VRTETQRLASKYDDVIIDTGGRDTASQRAALTVAEVLLVPCLPRLFDIWTLEKVTSLVRNIRTVNLELNAYTFLNRADPAGPDNDDAATPMDPLISLVTALAADVAGTLPATVEQASKTATPP